MVKMDHGVERAIIPGGDTENVEAQDKGTAFEIFQANRNHSTYSASISCRPLDVPPLFSLHPQNPSASTSGTSGASESYIAGERDALAKAFGALLPSQQALGQLFQAVDGVQARMAEEAAIVRSLQTHSASLTESVNGVSTRVSVLEETAIPTISNRCDELAGRPVVDTDLLSAVLHTVNSLRDVLQDLAVVQERSRAQSGLTVWSTGFAYRICVSLALRIQSAIRVVSSRLEGLLVSMSMSWLIGNDHSRQGPAANMRNVQHVVQKILSGTVFIALVEGLWFLQKKAKEKLPETLLRLLQPIQVLLKLARIVTWTAVFFLSIHTARRASTSVAAKLVFLSYPFRDRVASTTQVHHESDENEGDAEG
jgi:hypothetical protein